MGAVAALAYLRATLTRLMIGRPPGLDWLVGVFIVVSLVGAARRRPWARWLLVAVGLFETGRAGLALLRAPELAFTQDWMLDVPAAGELAVALACTIALLWSRSARSLLLGPHAG